MDNIVITIARGFGSGGKEIGQKLGAALGIPCYEEEIPKMASDYSGINEALFVKNDEKLNGSYLFNLMMKLKFSSTIEDPNNKDFISNDNLYNIQADIIKKLASERSCIIIGKCANHLLRDRDNVLSVYVEATRAECLKSVTAKYQVSEEEAHKMIKKTDKYRADYYAYYTGGDYWTNPTSYDIVLNSGRLGRDKCVEIIQKVLEVKFGSELPVPKNKTNKTVE